MPLNEVVKAKVEFVQPPAHVIDQAHQEIEKKTAAGYEQAWQVLSKYPHPDTVPLLTTIYDRTQRSDTMAKVVQTLSGIPHSSVLPLLTRALKGKDASVRINAARALGFLRMRQSVMHLARAARDEDAYLRYAAIDALGQFHDRRAVGALSAALKRRNTYGDMNERALIVENLVRTQHPNAFSPLAKYYRTVRKQLAAFRIRKQNSELRGSQWYAGQPATPCPFDDSEIITALIALGRTGNPNVVGPLLKLMRDEHTVLGQTARSALHTIRNAYAHTPVDRQPRNIRAVNLVFANALRKDGRLTEKHDVLQKAYRETLKPGNLARLSKPRAMAFFLHQLRDARTRNRLKR